MAVLKKTFVYFQSSKINRSILSRTAVSSKKLTLEQFYRVYTTTSIDYMEFATEEETKRFLSGLFYAWGQRIINLISKSYSLNQEQKEALELILLKPNNWQLHIKEPLATNPT